MRKAMLLLVAWLGAAATAPPPPPLSLSLWRLDCGSLVDPAAKTLPWRDRRIPVGCYLIRHGDRYMLWDAGLSARLLRTPHPAMTLARGLVDQLREIGVRPEQVAFLGISHYHGDHTGQAAAFPNARLLIGAEDLAALRRAPAPTGAAPAHLQPWLDGKSDLTALTEDHDVFGDGSVTVLMTRGHTPGHMSLLVKLASRPVMLTGDLWSSHQDLLRDDMPDFNTSFAETTASRERFRRLAARLDAMAVIQHEPDDVDKLPRFPAAAS